jgi:hypothetical protein
MAQVVQCLPSIPEAMGSISRTTKQEEKKKKKKGRKEGRKEGRKKREREGG